MANTNITIQIEVRIFPGFYIWAWCRRNQRHEVSDDELVAARQRYTRYRLVGGPWCEFDAERRYLR